MRAGLYISRWGLLVVICTILVGVNVPNSKAQETLEQGVTILKLIIVYPTAGHSAVYLERGGRKLYWDPGGTYGSEYEDCLDTNNSEFRAYCDRFSGFPWFELNNTRRHDVLLDDMAELLRVFSIYFLDGDSDIEVFTARLTGEIGDRAWNLIEAGAQLGSRAKFKTDRLTLTCTKAVSGYLGELGGMFSGVSRPWYPHALAKDLEMIDELEKTTYTFKHPQIQNYLRETRESANLPALAVCRGVLNLENDPPSLALINGRELCRPKLMESMQVSR